MAYFDAHAFRPPEPYLPPQYFSHRLQSSAAAAAPPAAPIKDANASYKFANALRMRSSAITSLAFYVADLGRSNLCAATSFGAVCIYTINEELELVRRFTSPTEDFIACCWTRGWAELEHHPLLAVGSADGIIRVIDCQADNWATSIVSHTGSVTVLQFHPTVHYVLLSASEDQSIRLWDLRPAATQSGEARCLAILAGHTGHTNTITSAAFNFSGSRIVSADADGKIKIWSVDIEDLLVQKRLATLHFADFTNSNLHWPKEPCTSEYTSKLAKAPVPEPLLFGFPVDCVSWCGDKLVSKQADTILMWRPTSDLDVTDFPKEYIAGKSALVFKIATDKNWTHRMKFATDPLCTIMATYKTPTVRQPIAEVDLWDVSTMRKWDYPLHEPNYTARELTCCAISINARYILWGTKEGYLVLFKHQDPPVIVVS